MKNYKTRNLGVRMQWAADYLNAPTCDGASEEVNFVDWVFNSAAVLKERAKLMELSKTMGI